MDVRFMPAVGWAPAFLGPVRLAGEPVFPRLAQAVPAGPNQAEQAQRALTLVLGAADSIISSGNALASQLDSIYSQYQDIPRNSLIEFAISWSAPFAGPVTDAYLQRDRLLQAVAKLQVGVKKGYEWMNAMSGTFFPKIMGPIEDVSTEKADEVGAVFDRVNKITVKMEDLITGPDGIKNLPAYVLAQAETDFFIGWNQAWVATKKTVGDTILAVAQLNANILSLMKALAQGAAGTTGFLSEVTKAAPVAVFVVAAGITIWLLLK